MPEISKSLCLSRCQVRVGQLVHVNKYEDGMSGPLEGNVFSIVTNGSPICQCRNLSRFARDIDWLNTAPSTCQHEGALIFKRKGSKYSFGFAAIKNITMIDDKIDEHIKEVIFGDPTVDLPVAKLIRDWCGCTPQWRTDKNQDFQVGDVVLRNDGLAFVIGVCEDEPHNAWIKQYPEHIRDLLKDYSKAYYQTDEKTYYVIQIPYVGPSSIITVKPQISRLGQGKSIKIGRIIDTERTPDWIERLLSKNEDGVASLFLGDCEPTVDTEDPTLILKPGTMVRKISDSSEYFVWAYCKKNKKPKTLPCAHAVRKRASDPEWIEEAPAPKFNAYIVSGEATDGKYSFEIVAEQNCATVEDAELCEEIVTASKTRRPDVVKESWEDDFLRECGVKNVGFSEFEKIRFGDQHFVCWVKTFGKNTPGHADVLRIGIMLAYVPRGKTPKSIASTWSWLMRSGYKLDSLDNGSVNRSVQKDRYLFSIPPYKDDSKPSFVSRVVMAPADRIGTPFAVLSKDEMIELCGNVRYGRERFGEILSSRVEEFEKIDINVTAETQFDALVRSLKFSTFFDPCPFTAENLLEIIGAEKKRYRKLFQELCSLSTEGKKYEIIRMLAEYNPSDFDILEKDGKYTKWES